MPPAGGGGAGAAGRDGGRGAAGRDGGAGAAGRDGGRGAALLPFERLAAAAAAGDCRPVYLLAGPDGFQQRAVIAALRTALAPDDLLEAVQTDLDGSAVQPADVVGVALTPGLIGRRLVIVHDAPWFAAPRGRGARAGDGGDGTEPGEAGPSGAEGGAGAAAGEADAAGPQGVAGGGPRRSRGARGARASKAAQADPLAPLLAYLDRPVPDAVVVFRCQQPPDSRRRVVKRMGEVGAVLVTVAPAADALPRWCVARAAAVHGVRLQAAAAAALCLRVPASLDLLDQELGKLAAYVGAGGSVGADAVRVLVAPTREESVFALMDAVAEGRAREAFELLRQMRLQGEAPLGILALLARQVRLLAFGRDTLDRGGGPDRLAAAAGGLHPYVARRTLAQARAFAEPDLEAALEAVWEAEWAVKSGRLDEEAALLDTVARLLDARVRAG